MNSLEMIVYDVSYGLAMTLIEHPNKYVVHIDLSANGNLSPLNHLADTRGLKPDLLFITHPHAIHLDDIGNIWQRLPKYIQYQEYNWDEVIKREFSHSKHITREYLKLIDMVPKGPYEGEATMKWLYWTPEQARQLFGEDRYINNSSLFITYIWNGFKISVFGDLWPEACDMFIERDDVRKQAVNTDILIAPHHGHTYPSKWPLIMGKPYVSLITTDKLDEKIEPGYETSGFAKGIDFKGGKRHCLVPSTDGTVVINMKSEGIKPQWSFSTEKYLISQAH